MGTSVSARHCFNRNLALRRTASCRIASIQLIGTSTDPWEKAAAVAIETASHTLRDLRVAEVVELDLV